MLLGNARAYRYAANGIADEEIVSEQGGSCMLLCGKVQRQCMYRVGHIDGGGCYETVKKLLREGETWQEPLADSAEADIFAACRDKSRRKIQR